MRFLGILVLGYWIGWRRGQTDGDVVRLTFLDVEAAQEGLSIQFVRAQERERSDEAEISTIKVTPYIISLHFTVLIGYCD